MLTPPHPRSTARITTKLSLGTLLITTFLLQIAAAVGITGWLTIRNGQRSVNELTTQLSREITARIDQHVQTYLDVPQLLNGVNQASATAGQLPLAQGRLPFEALHRYFWQQIQLSDDLTSIYFGSAQGEFVGVQQRQDGQTVLWRREAGGDRQTLGVDEAGNATDVITTMEYDPRQRPWYIAATAARTATWSEIYRFASEDYAHLGITAAVPLYDAAEQLTGVLAVDITLYQISEFLRDLTISPTGEAFIIERSGAIVASSVEESPFVEVNGEQERLNAVQSQSLLIQSSAQQLSDRLGWQDIRDRQQLVLEINQQPHWVEVTPVAGEGVPDWLIVVVIPEADFMSGIYASTRTTLWLCGGLLLVSLGVGLWTSRWIAQPIQRLNAAAKRLAGGDWDSLPTAIAHGQVQETAELAQSFQQMSSQLKQSFSDLAHKNEELKTLDRLKDEFLANTSHELRTPLNGIIGLSESLMEGATGPLPQETVSNLAMIAASGRRLSSLVNDILDFAHLQHQTLQLQGRSLNLYDVVTVVLALSGSDRKPIELRNRIPSQGMTVWADENRLQQILYNLIGNAIKFTEAGWVEVSAQQVRSPHPSLPGDPNLDEAEGAAPAEWLAITISDTGIGIPSDRLDRIFESFEQGDGSTARMYGGTGLGLAVTQQLVQLHGGQIWVQSVPGQGSQFTFTLPTQAPSQLPQSQSVPLPALPNTGEVAAVDMLLQQTPASTVLSLAKSELPTDLPAEILPEPERSEAIAPGHRFKILIADDEPINLQVLVNYLAVEKYEVIKASDGYEALSLIEQGLKPDLIVLDVMMPNMSGYEFCRLLRDRYSSNELPVLMLTARNQVDDLVEGLAAGANDYLRKPVSRAELLARIKTHLAIAQTNSAYARFVPHEFLQLLGRDRITEVNLGDQVQASMTVLFADIRSFTQMSETMTPQESFNFLNAYLSRVGPVVREHHGFIDKYIGDAVMALFPREAEDAIQAAIAMQAQVTAYNRSRFFNGETPIAIGVGIHTGSLILGTIGEQERMESTVIADAVNLASRMERLTKLYGANILASTATLQQLPDPTRYNYRFLDRVQVRGKNQLVSVWEFFDGDASDVAELKAKTRTQFEQAVCLYHNQEFEAAQEKFLAILQVNAVDNAAHLYLKRCQRFQRHGLPEDWDQYGSV